MTINADAELLQVRTRELKQATDEIARLERRIELTQFAFRKLLGFRCLDGVALFDKSENAGYSKYDEYAPFLSESFLYNSVGKETARSILGRVRAVADMLGMPDIRFYSPDLTEDEEVRLEMATDMRHRHVREHFYGRANTSEEREAARAKHETSTRESVRRSRSVRDGFLKAIARELDEDARKDAARQVRKLHGELRAKTRQIKARIGKSK